MFMRNTVHTSITLTRPEEKEILYSLKERYYKNETDKRLFLDSMKIHLWWKSLLGKLPGKYNDERVKKIFEQWAEKKVKIKVER